MGMDRSLSHLFEAKHAALGLFLTSEGQYCPLLGVSHTAGCPEIGSRQEAASSDIQLPLRESATAEGVYPKGMLPGGPATHGSLVLLVDSEPAEVTVLGGLACPHHSEKRK